MSSIPPNLTPTPPNVTPTPPKVTSIYHTVKTAKDDKSRTLLIPHSPYFEIDLWARIHLPSRTYVCWKETLGGNLRQRIRWQYTQRRAVEVRWTVQSSIRVRILDIQADTAIYGVHSRRAQAVIYGMYFRHTVICITYVMLRIYEAYRGPVLRSGIFLRVGTGNAYTMNCF